MNTSVGSESTDASGRVRLRVRPGTGDDAAVVARMHTAHISTGFLSMLGPRLLTRLYRRVTRADGCFLVVTEFDGKPVGFVAGSMDTRRLLRRFVVLDGPAVVVTTGWSFLRHWRQTLETLSQARSGQATPEAATDVEAELLSVAVDDGFRGAGVGSALTRAFLDEAARRGAGSARVVVGAANHEAIRMYGRCGFATVGHFEHHRGTASVLLRSPLVPSPAAETGEPGMAPVGP